jgi:hypothetical protein
MTRNRGGRPRSDTAREVEHYPAKEAAAIVRWMLATYPTDEERDIAGLARFLGMSRSNLSAILSGKRPRATAATAAQRWADLGLPAYRVVLRFEEGGVGVEVEGL